MIRRTLNVNESTALWVVVGFAIVSGCAEDNVAILELELSPPVEVESGFATLQIQFRKADVFSFDQPWVGDDLRLELDEVKIPIKVSLISDEAPVAVNLKLRYCAAQGCAGEATGPGLRELRFAFENPFYIGSRTSWKPDPALLDPAREDGLVPVSIGRCAIRGCISGDDLDNYCRADGSHFCE